MNEYCTGYLLFSQSSFEETGVENVVSNIIVSIISIVAAYYISKICTGVLDFSKTMFEVCDDKRSVY